VTILQDDSRQFDTIGRLGLMLSLGAIAVTIGWNLRNSSKQLHDYFEAHPRSQRAGIVALVGTPVVLAGVAAAGYSITALVLTSQFQACLALVAAGFVIYGVLLRWFMIRERRIALAEAIEARRARREAAEKAGEKEGGPEESQNPEDDEELDLEDVARQTRRLLRALVGIGVVVALFYNISRTLPLDRTVADIMVGGSLSLLGLLRAILAGAITWTVVKNLPGILDLAGLRESGIAPGTRYAVATLCQYAVAAIGIFWLTRELSVDWARFGWIAAALSVGLGFGLQEIVANFVCGIIILFERPIRVGDVVTVGDVTGRVSKVRMRATTITNWERQEFVVPNKEFITGSLINWTLTSALNRVSIPIGVAYGSDTALARRILTEIVEAHPLILEDPAPVVTFDAFGDSTLNLTLRFYLPDLENRLAVITEVNEAIDRRYKEAGIEIAFPQRDLHLRSVPEGLLRPADGGESGN
jgi:potassium efflux system protein